jgi:hypothetical protein
MKCELYIDPAGEPWRVTDEAGAMASAVAMDVRFREDDPPDESYNLMLRFARKGRSPRFYLVGVVTSDWGNASLAKIAGSC